MTEAMVFAWVNKDKRYLISTRGYLEEGEAMLKHIWRHVSAGVNVDDNMVYLDIPKLVSA